MSTVDRDPKANQPPIQESQLPDINNVLPEAPETLQTTRHEVKKGINKKALFGGLGGGALALALVVGGVAAANNADKEPTTIGQTDPDTGTGEVVDGNTGEEESNPETPMNDLTSEEYAFVSSTCTTYLPGSEDITAKLPMLDQVSARYFVNALHYDLDKGQDPTDTCQSLIDGLALL